MDLNRTRSKHSENSYKWPLYRPAIQARPCISFDSSVVISKLEKNRIVTLKTGFQLLDFSLIMSVLILEFIAVCAVVLFLFCSVLFCLLFVFFFFFGCLFVFPPLQSTMIYFQVAEALVSPTKLSASSSVPSVALQTMNLFVSSVNAFILFTLSFGNYIKPLALAISCKICVYFLPSENS